MILDKLEAVNFGKYRRLSLADIPDKGLVGVIGPNESGKTTIGETICFALFGKTASDRVPEEHIHWREDEMTVSLDFRDADGVPWRVIREIDRSGTYAASLERLDEEHEFVKGVGKVSAHLKRILRLDFEEFTYGFFLGQKELDVSTREGISTKRRLIDELTGVGTIERITDQTSEELEELINRRSSIEQELTLARKLLEEYSGRSTGDLDDPSAEIDRLSSEEEKLGKRVEELEAALRHKETSVQSDDRLRNFLAALKARVYAYVLTERRGLLEKSRERLIGKLDELEKRNGEVITSSRRRERFLAALHEMTRLVGMRHNELKRALSNNLPSEFAPGEEDILTGDSKVEQLCLIRARAGSATEKVRALRREDNYLLAGLLFSFLVAIGSYRFLWSWKLGVFPFYGGICACLFFLISALYFRVRLNEWKARETRLKESAARIEKEVASIREAAKLCADFDTSRLDSIQSKLSLIGGGLEEAFREIEKEFPDFLKGSAEYLRSQKGADRLRKQIDELREDLADIRHVLSDLDGWLGRFSGSPFFKAPSPDVLSVEEMVFERDAFRRWIKNLNRDIEACQKVLFTLETECRSPVSPRICSSFGDFQATLGKICEETGATHRLQIDDLRLVHKGELGKFEDPVDFIKKQEQRLSSLCSGSRATAQEIDKLRRELADLRDELGCTRLARAAAEQSLARVEPDAARCRQLEDEIEQLEADKNKTERDLRVREILLDLLTGLAERLRLRLGPALADYIRYVLPRITEFRYREVRLNDDLSLEVYSPEKGDYVGLDSLSGGTVDQLLVSLRLAFAKALMDTKMPSGHNQFLFFDEPLSSFDTTRGEAFLTLLRSFGGTFAQVFLVSHLRGLSRLFDAMVRTELDRDELAVDFSKENA